MGGLRGKKKKKMKIKESLEMGGDIITLLLRYDTGSYYKYSSTACYGGQSVKVW